MKIEAAGVGAHPRIGAAEKAIQRQSRLLRGEIPQRLVDRLAETVRQCARVAAARAQHAMDHAEGRLATQTRKRLGTKGTLQFGTIRQRIEQAEEKAEAGQAGIGAQLQ